MSVENEVQVRPRSWPPAVAPKTEGCFSTSGGGHAAMFGAVGVATAVGAVMAYRIRSAR